MKPGRQREGRGRCGRAPRLLSTCALVLTLPGTVFADVATGSASVPADVSTTGAVGLPLERVASLHFGDVLFRHYAGDARGALLRALAWETDGRLAPQDAPARYLVASMLVDAGIAEAARTRFEGLLEPASLEAAAIDPNGALADEVHLALGRLAQGREDHDTALDHFARVGSARMTPELELAAAASELALTRVDAAAQRLERWTGPDDLAPWARFNLAVALVRAGRRDVGVALLEALGAAPVTDGAAGAELRDRANLAAGHALLLAGDHERAEVALLRVRSRGLFRDQGLVALGWLADARGDVERAIGYWRQVLAGRAADEAPELASLPQQAARLEAALAIAHGLGELQQAGGAAQRYEATLVSIADADAALQSLSTSLPRWLERLLDDRAVSPPETGDPPMPPALLHVAASAEFTAALASLRTLVAERGHLDAMLARIDVLGSAVEDTRSRSLAVPVRQASFAERGEALRARRDALASVLAIDAPEARARAFATAQETRALEQLDALLASPALAAADASLRTKARVLRGHLLWGLERESAYRRWRAERSFGQVDAALARLPVVFDRVLSARADRPEDADRFADALASLRARALTARQRVDGLAAARQGALIALVEGQLDEQRSRLAAYRIDATYALALLHDRGVRSLAGASMPALERSAEAGGAAPTAAPSAEAAGGDAAGQREPRSSAAAVLEGASAGGAP